MPRKGRGKRQDHSDEEYEAPSRMEEEEDFDIEDYGPDDFVVGDEELDERDFEPPGFDDEEEEKPKRKARGGRRAREDFTDDLELVSENRRAGGRLQRGARRNQAMEEEDQFDDEDFIDDTFGQTRGETSYFHDFYESNRGEMYEKKVDLTQIYEPDEIKERFATTEDERIKTLDMPERFQIRFKNRENPTNEELHEQTIWVYNKFAYELHPDLARSSSKSDLMELIFKILNLIRVQNHEVMYIYSYEFLKEFPIEGFTLEHLWEIYDLDMDWNALYRKKNAIRKLLDIVENLNPVDPFIREHLESCQDLQSLQDLHDYVNYTMLKFKVETQSYGGGLSQFKPPTKARFVTEALKHRLDELASRVAVSPDELAHNLENDAKKLPNIKMPDFYRDLPEEAIRKYIDPSIPFLSNSLKCLYSIVGLMARDLYYHPIIRKILRKEYLTLPVRLVTNPTEKGRKELDLYHQHFFVKRIRLTQPLSSLRGDQWLTVLEEEKKGRIEVKFEFPWRDDDTQDLFKQNLMKLYLAQMRGLSPEEVEITSKWNIFRSEVIKMFLDEYMYSYLERWIRTEMTIRAERVVIRDCGKKFRQMINQQPYKKAEGERKGRVFAFMPEHPRGQVALATIDVNGEVLDRNVLNYLHHNRQWAVTDKLLQEELYKERKKLKAAIERHKPHLFIVGACFVEAFYLRTQLQDLANELVEELKRERSADFPNIWVEIGDPTLPWIFGKSEVSLKEFSEDTVQMRAAISLGRFQQDPLAETLQLWDEDPDKNMILQIRLHGNQDHVDRAKLMNEYEKISMEVVNNVGVDINLLLKHRNLRAPLQFVSGLGPRKALYLIENIIDRCEILNFRFQLCSSKILSKCVYDNCAGFIKVRLFSRGDTNYDVLDATRIHPIHYEITRRIAKVLVRHSADRDDVVQRIMENPHMYLQNLEEKKRLIELEAMKSKWNWDALISYIKDELSNPYFDHRPPMVKLTTRGNDLFYTLTKENHDTFRDGALVTGRVTKVYDASMKGGEKKEGIVVCRLDCGILGSIHPNDLPARTDIKVGIYVRARIKKIMYKSLHVYLSLKDNNDHDTYYALIHPKLKNVNCEVIREEDFPQTYEPTTSTARFRPRNIRHNFFKNISITKAIDYLTNREVGSFVIRPSSKGIDHLSITWKFYEAVYANLDIKEEDKNPNAVISNKLRIGNEIYQDLDEIIKMYIEPCNLLVKNIVRHKKFLRGPIEKVVETLREDRKNNPEAHAYYFCFVPNAPHYLILAYLNQSMNLVTEFIKVKPRGLYFHEQFFPNLQDVISWMKQNYHTEGYQRYVRKIKVPIILEPKPQVAEPPPRERRYSQPRFRGGPSSERRRRPDIREESARRSIRRVGDERSSVKREPSSVGRRSEPRPRNVPGTQQRGPRTPYGGDVWGNEQSRGRASVERFERSRSRSIEKRAMQQAGGFGYAQPWAYQTENAWGGGYGFPY